jgi:hypothetical protein
MAQKLRTNAVWPSTILGSFKPAQPSIPFACEVALPG